MDPYRLRVLAEDDLLGLAVDEILAVEPGAPDAIRVIWPRPRSLPPNYGHLAGLLAANAIAPIRGSRLTLLIASASSSQPGPTAGPLRKPAPATSESGRQA